MPDASPLMTTLGDRDGGYTELKARMSSMMGERSNSKYRDWPAGAFGPDCDRESGT